MALAPVCSYTNINNFLLHGAHNKCEFTQKYCGNETSYVNTITFYYCTLDENLLPMLLISIPWLLLCFYWLCSTSQKHLEPSLARVANTFKLSEAFAGVTVVALANGAPDIISAYVATNSQQQGGVDLAFGSLFGASVFTTTIILAKVIYNAKELKLSATTLIRDCGFYILADLYFFYLGTLPRVDLYHTMVLLFAYVVYMTIIIYEEIRDKKPVVEVSTPGLPSPTIFGKEFSPIDNDLKTPPSPTIKIVISPSNDAKIKAEDFSFQAPTVEVVQVGSEVEINIIVENAKVSTELEKAKLNLIENLKDYAMMIWIHIELPLNLIRQFTIPKVNRFRYNRMQIAVYPFLSGLFALWQFGLLGTYGDNPIFWALFSIVTGVLGAALYLLAIKRKFLRGIAVAFTFIGLLMAILWVRFAATLLVDLLVLLQVASGLPSNVIGITILAWGNSINEFFMAKKDISGIFSGQFFNMMVGLGTLLFFEAGKEGLNLFADTVNSRINFLLLLASLTGITSTLLYGLISKFNMSKRFANFLVAFYGLFCILMIGIIFVH